MSFRERIRGLNPEDTAGILELLCDMAKAAGTGEDYEGSGLGYVARCYAWILAALQD